MSKAAVIQPWKKVCILRKEIRERELKLEDFAVDLFLIVNRSSGGAVPFYCDPDQFFATTYATENLRKFCAGVLARLAGRNDGVSLVNIAQTFGGGKTHALATMYYFCTLEAKLPKQHPAVAVTLERLAAVYAKQNKSLEAKQFADRAAAIRASQRR